MAPADLLQWIGSAQKTGTLTITGAEFEKRIVFRGGRVLSTASTNPREYLGQFLMSHGFISEEELRKAMEVQAESHILLGKILCTIGAIAEEDLVRLMRLKAEEEVYDLFLWSDGEFVFEDERLPEMQMIPLRIDVTGMIMEGYHRMDEWKRIREIIPSAAVIPLLEVEIDEASLSEVEKTIVHALNGQRTIEEIVLESRSSEYVVSKTIAMLAREGFVRLGQAVEPAADSGRNDDDPLALEEDSGSLIERAETALRERRFAESMRLLKAAQSLQPDDLEVRSALRGAEMVIVEQLRRNGLADDGVPELVKPLEEMQDVQFTPAEAFVVSRVNGSWSLGSIIKVSPMREVDSLLIFDRLVREGIVALRRNG